jgi:hypothetical protein
MKYEITAYEVRTRHTRYEKDGIEGTGSTACEVRGSLVSDAMFGSMTMASRVCPQAANLLLILFNKKESRRAFIKESIQ